MTIIQPTDSTCYPLKLPIVPTLSKNGTDKLDDCTRAKLGLKYRTGAAVTSTRSNIYVHGGLTLPINLAKVNSFELQKELILYFTKLKHQKNNFKFQDLHQWISSETFFLDLISRTWYRVETNVADQFLDKCDIDKKRNPLDSNLCPLKKKLFHSMCYADGSLFIFGGLTVSSQNGYELIATNELWQLDIKKDDTNWILVSDDPTITRRFNHTMHVKNANTDRRDTKLIIVGGLNNLNEPVNKIDVFNVTKNCWQDDAMPSDPLDLVTNIDDKPINLTNDRNFSILVENNEAKICALAFYTPNDQKQCTNRDRSDSFDDLNEISESKLDISEDEKMKRIISPITALPLVNGSHGMRMAYNSLQKKEHLLKPFNLRSPTGDVFGYDIIAGGFYGPMEASHFNCYIFDIPSGRWTLIGLNCPDYCLNKHRFWRVFVWKSHRKAIFLGTKKNDGFSPSVQRFDYLLSFGLSMLNAFSKKLSPIYGSGIASNSLLTNNLNEIFKKQLVLDSKGHKSTTSAQFEKYIRYVVPSSELSSTSAVFPPYAMVLGRDALEIVGKSLADFEFVSSDGEAVDVPLYLLRKRWGRYFDFLLSRAYSHVVKDYENSGNQSSLVRISPRDSRTNSKTNLKDRSTSIVDSLPTFPRRGSMSNQLDFQSNGKDKIYANKAVPGTMGPESHFRYSNALPEELFSQENQPKLLNNSGSSKTSSTSFSEDDDDESIAPHAVPMSKQNSSRTFCSVSSGNLTSKPLKHAASVTSSSGGLVFRVPFQENNEASRQTVQTKDGDLDPTIESTQKKRRSSLVGLPSTNPMFNFALSNSFRQRRASHPAVFLNNLEKKPSDTHPPARLSSRSSISYVSSSSDRRGNSLSKGGSRRSSLLDVDFKPGVLNAVLPPQTEIPTEPLPVPSLGKKNNRFLTDLNSGQRDSPLISRRSSYFSTSYNPDFKHSSDGLPNTLDKQILKSGNESMNERKPTLVKNPMSHINLSPRSSQVAPSLVSNGSNSYNSVRSNSGSMDKSRFSITSNTESIGSNGSCSANLDPLMIPRSLYLPWPTLTINAFAEFFYTGQINTKWLFAPVALDLLVMAKTYEIPLLYSLVEEILYLLVGRKEESFFVICYSLIEKLKEKALKHLNGDDEAAEKLLLTKNTYRSLLKVRSQLESTEYGFFNLCFLDDINRNSSVSTTESDPLMDCFRRSSSLRTDILNQHPMDYPLMTNSPRESITSFDPSEIPSNFILDKKRGSSIISPIQKLKSNLNRKVADHEKDDGDFTFNRSSLNNIYNRRAPINEKTSLNDHAANNFSLLSAFSLDKIDSSASDSSSSFGNESTKENITDDLRPANETRGNSNGEKNPDLPAVSGNKVELNTRLGIGLNMLSLDKLSYKIKKGDDFFDESVDPLVRDSSHNAKDRKESILSGSAFSTGKPAKTTQNDFESMNLENMTSPNSLPPVDYVIKSIYKAAVLVDNSRLMLRCLNCLELSKTLKKFKNEMKGKDFVAIP